MRVSTVVAALSAMVMLAVAPSGALAEVDPYSPEAMKDAPKERSRLGFAFGFGIGGGDIVCESEEDVCDGVVEAGGINLQATYMLQQKLGVYFDFWIMAHTQDRFTLSQTITTVGAKYWLLPRLWVMAGLGGAHARATIKGPFGGTLTNRTDSVLGVMAGVGYEVLTRKSLAIDIQLRGGTGFYDDDTTKGRNLWFGVGFTWY